MNQLFGLQHRRDSFCVPNHLNKTRFMKTLRFIGIALLTVLMSVSFSACGGSDDDDNGGGSSKSIDGTWYMKSMKGFYYYPANGTFEPHNSSKNPDVEYDDYSSNVIITVTKNGENITTKWNGDGYSQTLIFEKKGANEYLCTESGYVYNRIVMKTMTDKQLVFDWYDAYFEDANGTVKDKEHFYVARYSFMR